MPLSRVAKAPDGVNRGGAGRVRGADRLPLGNELYHAGNLEIGKEELQERLREALRRIADFRRRRNLVWSDGGSPATSLRIFAEDFGNATGTAQTLRAVMGADTTGAAICPDCWGHLPNDSSCCDDCGWVMPEQYRHRFAVAGGAR